VEKYSRMEGSYLGRQDAKVRGIRFKKSSQRHGLGGGEATDPRGYSGKRVDQAEAKEIKQPGQRRISISKERNPQSDQYPWSRGKRGYTQET